MSEIDAALMEAWQALPEATRKIRLGLLLQRRAAGIKPRPVRPWCVAIRGADLRINEFWCVVERDDPDDRWSAETVTITGRFVRKLCAPVRIDWPGIDWCLAADKLGRHTGALRGLIQRGILEVRYHPAMTMGKKGNPVPVVWSEWPLDPAANNLKGPDPHWGSLWQWLWERIPENMAFQVRRVPRIVRHPNRRGIVSDRQWGWRFLCPRCAKRCIRLYHPLPPLTLPEVLGEVPRAAPWMLECPQAPSPVPTLPGPRLADPAPRPADRAVHPFACRKCHGISDISLVAGNGWNQFVRSVSDGVLYGSEVKKPASLVVKRKRAFRRRVVRNAEGHARMLRMLQTDLSLPRIAARLGRTKASVVSQVRWLRSWYGARTREELVEKARWVLVRGRPGNVKQEARGRGA